MSGDRVLGTLFSDQVDDWFKELFQQASFKRLQRLVDEARIARAKMPTKNQSGSPPALRPPIRTAPAYPRSEVKRKIVRALLRKQKATSRELCDILDEKGIWIPVEWQKTGNRSWGFAYNNDPDLRKKIQHEISRVKGEIRSSGSLE